MVKELCNRAWIYRNIHLRSTAWLPCNLLFPSYKQRCKRFIYNDFLCWKAKWRFRVFCLISTAKRLHIKGADHKTRAKLSSSNSKWHITIKHKASAKGQWSVREGITKMSKTKGKWTMIKHKNINLHGIPKSLFSLGSVDFWKNEPWGRKRRGWWNGWRKGEEHNNQNQTNKSNKMGQTWQDTDTKKMPKIVSFFVSFLLFCYLTFNCLSKSKGKTNKKKNIRPLLRKKKWKKKIIRGTLVSVRQLLLCHAEWST